MAYNTWVAICNSALIRLGAARITQLTDASKNAQVCNAQYELSRDEVLNEYEWRDAKKRATLAADSTAPDFGWDYRYALPNGLIRLLSVQVGGLDIDHVVEGGYILCDEGDGIDIAYLKQIVNPAEFHNPILVKAIVLRLAADICYGITQSKTLGEQVLVEYADVLKEAKSKDALQDSVPDEDQDAREGEWAKEGR